MIVYKKETFFRHYEEILSKIAINYKRTSYFFLKRYFSLNLKKLF